METSGEDVTAAAKVIYVERRSYTRPSVSFFVGSKGVIRPIRGFNRTVSEMDERDDAEQRFGLRICMDDTSSYRGHPSGPRVMAALMNLVLCGIENGSIEPDVQIRHRFVDSDDPCEGSLAEHLFRMIVTSFPDSGYRPTFRCILPEVTTTTTTEEEEEVPTSTEGGVTESRD